MTILIYSLIRLSLEEGVDYILFLVKLKIFSDTTELSGNHNLTYPIKALLQFLR